MLFAGDVEEVRNTQEGIEVRYRCFCGHEGVWHTGRAREEGRRGVPPAACGDRLGA